MNPPTLQSRTLLLLLTVVTLAFGAILWPLNGAIFWGVVLAILFTPLHRRLQRRMPRRRNLAALATLGVCLVIVILPMGLIGASLADEISTFVQRKNNGTFFTAELAEELHISFRTAARIVEKLEQNGYIVEVGRSVLNGRGRPTRVFQLLR